MSEQEVPDSVYEMDTDEMIEFLSLGELMGDCSTAIPSNCLAQSKDERASLILKFVEEVQGIDSIDSRLKEYVLGNLILQANSDKRAWNLNLGRTELPWDQKRWRASAVSVFLDAGCTQAQVSEMLGYEERTINNMVRFAKDNPIRDVVDYMKELCGQSYTDSDLKTMCRIINNKRKIT